MNPPTVSVIIPTYNRLAYLQEAIDSVLAQTYTDYEIIVVDDGSTDGMGDALRALYRDHLGGRLRYRWQENAGRSAARNAGVTLSQGKYLAFLDDDDTYLPHKLARQVHLLEERSDVDLVAGGFEQVDASGKGLALVSPWERYEDLSARTWLCACPFLLQSCLLRREWWER
ncbi:MAG: glycosyltransferase family 2 protein, partial [Anaerolineales bacterium]|nr:glycosyltransferase family 2 protein [Anaerolineales bacterium]